MEVFDEAHRVLKKTGTCWVNLGDTYCGPQTKEDIDIPFSSRLDKPKSKCLSLIPFRFALAMTARGWILRNVLVWHKPNCMPSSAKDRFTVDFEYVFFFTKSKRYFFAQQFEPIKEDSLRRCKYPSRVHPDSPYKKQLDGADRTQYCNPKGRNHRSVWTVPLTHTRHPHFATYPIGLCSTPIKAGCPEQVCKKCGTPQLTIDTGGNPNAFNLRVRDVKENRSKLSDRRASKQEVQKYNERVYVSKRQTKRILGCSCNCGFESGIVLDPFMGSGTTALAAKKLGRNYLGFELNPAYIKIAEYRIKEAA